jgi:hypothetical protein
LFCFASPQHTKTKPIQYHGNLTAPLIHQFIDHHSTATKQQLAAAIPFEQDVQEILHHIDTQGILPKSFILNCKYNRALIFSMCFCRHVVDLSFGCRRLRQERSSFDEGVQASLHGDGRDHQRASQLHARAPEDGH